MKYIFLLLLFSPLLTIGQQQESAVNLPIDTATNRITFTEVVKVDSASADDLYSRAKLFIAEVYKSSKDVMQLNDNAAKTVLMKPIIINHVRGFGEYGYTSYQFTIQCKDGRYKYTITDFYHHGREYPMNKMKDGGPLEQETAPGNTKKHGFN